MVGCPHGDEEILVDLELTTQNQKSTIDNRQSMTISDLGW